MPSLTQSIVSVVKPIAEKAGVKLHSSNEASLRSQGRLFDAKKITGDELIDSINRICGGYLERKEKVELAKALKRYI